MCPGLLLVWMFYSEGDPTFKQASRYVKERLKSSLKKFLVDTGILSNNTKFLSHECLMTFCSLTKYNDNPSAIRLYTNPWPFYRTRPSTGLWEVFNRIFVTDVASCQGTCTPPDTWSRPIWDLYMFYLLRPILFRNLYFSRTVYFEHPSVPF